MIKLNLWDKNSIIEALKSLYRVSLLQITNILKNICVPAQDDLVKIFCEETSIELDCAEATKDLFLKGIIVSATIDNNEHLLKKGLLPIDVLLENDSPINRFLLNHYIKIDPGNHTLYYKKNKFYIPEKDEDCKWCAYKRDSCFCSDRSYKELSCGYRKGIGFLSQKLYSDNAEIEMFISGTNEKMLSYSTVSNYPEILHTIDNFFRIFGISGINLGNEWYRQKKTCIIDLWVRYEDMSYRGIQTKANNEEAEHFFCKYINYCSQEYNDVKDLPDCFWDNIWIITSCLYNLSTFDDDYPEIYAGIKHGVTIPLENISIREIE